jgi:hypothetical protein
MKPLLASAISALGLLSACAHGIDILDVPPDRAPPGNDYDYACDSDTAKACQITIDVSMGKCEPMYAKVKVPQNKLIHWKLVNNTNGWRFASKGIDFTAQKPADPVNPNAPQAFDQEHGAGTPQYQWHVKTGAPAGKYPYTVKLENGSATCSFDPGIWV